MLGELICERAGVVNLGAEGMMLLAAVAGFALALATGSDVLALAGGALAGAIGVSGDGIDQDDMIAFLGLANAGAILGTVANAPAATRADNITVPGGRLRYVNCPVSPFLDTNATNVCNGI